MRGDIDERYFEPSGGPLSRTCPGFDVTAKKTLEAPVIERLATEEVQNLALKAGGPAAKTGGQGAASSHAAACATSRQAIAWGGGVALNSCASDHMDMLDYPAMRFPVLHSRARNLPRHTHWDANFGHPLTDALPKTHATCCHSMRMPLPAPRYRAASSCCMQVVSGGALKSERASEGSCSRVTGFARPSSAPVWSFRNHHWKCDSSRSAHSTALTTMTPTKHSGWPTERSAVDTGGLVQADRRPRGDGRGWILHGSQHSAGCTAVGPAPAGSTSVEAASAVSASKLGVTLPRHIS